MNMISQVIQPVVDTIDSASKVTKAVVKMLARSDRDDQEMAKESDEGAKQKSPQQVSHRYSAAEDAGVPHSSSTAVGKERTVMHANKDEDHLVHLVPSSEEDRNQTSRLSSVMPEAVEDSSSANKVRSVRKDDNRVAPAMFNESVMDELCNLQYEIQLTPRLSPILEETGETNSSASSSAIVDKMGFLEGESISSLLVPSESTAVAGSSVPTPATSTSTLEKTNIIQSGIPAQRKEAEKPCSTDMELTRQVSSLSGGKPDAMGDHGDDMISIAESSEEEATKASAAIEAWSTSRLLSVSPVSSTATSSPIIEKARTIISHVMQPVVDTIDSASKVTKTAGKSIAKKVKSMWKYRSGRKKGKRGKGKSDKNAARNGQQDILDKHSGEEVIEEDKMEDENDAEDEDEDDEGDEETSTAEVDSFSELSGAFNDGEVVGTSDAPPSIVEDNTVPKPADVLNDVAVEEFCFFEAESSSVISTPFLDASMTRSCDPTSSSLAVPEQAKPENSTPDILEDEQLSSNSKSPENKMTVAETDEEQASDINALQSEDDGPEHNIYSIFENIFREEFSKKLENSLRQGLCDAVRVYVPERSSTESLESTNISCELGDHYRKKEVDTSSVGPQDSLESGSTSITSFASYQHLSDASLKGIPPEGLDSKRKSLWKRWKMRRARKILPGLLECHCTPRASDSVASDSKATEPAIKSILKKVTSIWK
ncbi:bromodomain adjacent to zinc finger domain protein 2B-like [Hippocampus comes]|uniref:bromodomain adjacent to zinc finger domain protein 2B-like n=1 Tax=Hippocampus comes TaxID=109280 RepID=UPI00094E9B9F|nr:PREDICTED: bromodomain adjacent to zinc finger domain protein 2B-like [Hippocampus comes]